MNIFAPLRRFFRPLENKSSESLALFREIYGGRPSRSGVSVNWNTALEVSTVLACVRVIANGVAQVPWRVYLDENGVKRIANEHPLQTLLSRKPNRWQTSFQLRETIVYHALLTGNAYVWIGRAGRARNIRVMEPIEPRRVSVEKSRDGDLTYTVRADDGATQVFGPADIWHLRGPSWDATQGMDSVRLARDAIGLTIATEQTQADLHRNGANVSGLLSMDGTIGKERFEFLSAWLDRHSVDGDRAHKPIILDNGAKFSPFQMTGVDAQHLETRKHQVEEVCRSFGVLPIMVFQADKAATYASAEQMFLAHVVHTLMPWYTRIEQSADAQLLSDEDSAAGYYTKFIPNGLLRGASKDRSEFYATALGSGGHGTAWMTTNEVRALEEMNPIDGGDELPAPPELTPQGAPQ